MKIIQDVLAELFSMFWADARMTTTILIIAGLAATLLNYTSLNPLFAGALLLIGSLITVVEAAIRHARLKS
jgi:hypothetical protein